MQNASGVALATQYSLYFHTGTAADTTAPTVLGVAPTNNFQNVGLNGLVVLTFSKPIDPLTINSASISLSYGTTPTQISTTVTFDSTNTYVTLTPVEPLPASTTITVSVTNGVQDVAGNKAAAFSSSFKTGAAADTVAPYITAYSPANSATNVPTNAAVVVQFSEPISAASVLQNYCNYYYNGQYYYYSSCVFDVNQNAPIPSTISVSPDGMTVTFVPQTPLTPGDTIFVESYSVMDLAGNLESRTSSRPLQIGQGKNCLVDRAMRAPPYS